MNIPIPADGVDGLLIRGHNGTIVFRVYSDIGSFIDYDIMHSDLLVTIKDRDAYFYNKGDNNIIDHSPETLGLK